MLEERERAPTGQTDTPGFPTGRADHRHGCRDGRKAANFKRGKREDGHTVEEMNTLLLLDHNEDSEPFPGRLLEKSVTFVSKFCYISRPFCFHPPFMLLTVFDTPPSPAATRTFVQVL